MQTMTRTARRPFRAAITENGIVPTKKCFVYANHGYYFGGSSSPSFVLVLAVTAETVVYCDTYKLEPRSEQRWIFEDLATRAGETMRQHARNAAAAAKMADISPRADRLNAEMAKVAADRAASHGAPVALADYDRVAVTVAGEGDVYGRADQYGVLTDWNSEANRAVIECNRETVPAFTDAGLTVVSVETIRACPTV